MDRRRLAAILVADVVGYSRLMEADESGTHAALKRRRSEIFDPLIQEHAGRLVKFMGDGMLVEFPSAVSAVSCALAIQKRMAEENRQLPEAKQIALRIGINVGDVIDDGAGDIFGEGVNIAARLEGLADSGRIAISGIVHDSLGNRIGESFADAGEHQLKNISRPVHVWRWAPDAGDAVVPPARARPASEELSILVLPFVNLTGEPQQDHFVDGFTGDIITELSRYKGLSVRARHTSFHYRGRNPGLDDLERELGIAYVIEGSIRRSGTRVRVSAQLVEAASGRHVWADRYDRDQSDLFTMQDELIAAIASTLEGRMISAGAASAQRKRIANWSAYDYFLKARELGNAHKEDEAIPFLIKATTLDPDFAHAHAWLATCLTIAYILELRPALLTDAKLAAERALALDSADASSHHAMGMVCLYNRQLERALRHFDRAAALNPHDVSISGDRAQCLRFRGRFDDALTVVNSAIDRDPFPSVWLLGVRGSILFHMARYREALDEFWSMPYRRHFNVLYSISAMGHLSDIDGARTDIAVLREMKPGVPLATLIDWMPFSDASPAERLRQGLIKAGLTE
jgi:adenylate cyclase